MINLKGLNPKEGNGAYFCTSPLRWRRIVGLIERSCRVDQDTRIALRYKNHRTVERQPAIIIATDLRNNLSPDDFAEVTDLIYFLEDSGGFTIW